jgi:diamine N-acetyltransferase
MLDVYNDSEHLSQLAAYADDMPVGYVMYGFDPDTRDWWIVRLMVAHDQQGKGYGRAIMQAVIAQLSAQPGCDAIHISFVPENAAARALYSSLGFVDTGRIEDGEVVYRLALMGNAQP